MDRLLFLIAALLFPSAALAQSYRLSDVSCEQGKTCDATVTVTGTRTTKSVVTFYVGVKGDSAKPGIDYPPYAKSMEVLATDTKLTFSVPTTVTGSTTTKVATSKLLLNTTGTLLDGTGKLSMTPKPVILPPVVCWDGSTVIPPAVCPIKPVWSVVPLNGALNARAVKDCSSIYRTAETDRNEPPQKYPITFNGVVKGTIYRLVPPGVWGTNMSWGRQDYPPNIDGQKGDVWTVLALDTPDPIPNYPWSATVAQECLEGVKKN